MTMEKHCKSFTDKLLEKEAILPHVYSEVICVKCFHRYICVRSESVLLKDLECESCGSGYIIETGQPMED